MAYHTTSTYLNEVQADGLRTLFRERGYRNITSVARGLVATAAYKNTKRSLDSTRTQLREALASNRSVPRRLAKGLTELFGGDERLTYLTSRTKPEEVQIQIAENDVYAALIILLQFKLDRIMELYKRGDEKQKFGILKGLEEIVENFKILIPSQQ